MKEKKYHKQPGDYEIRFLKDGRVVFVGPDQELLDLAQAMKIAPDLASDLERNTHESDKPSPTEAGATGHDGTGDPDSGTLPADLRD